MFKRGLPTTCQTRSLRRPRRSNKTSVCKASENIIIKNRRRRRLREHFINVITARRDAGRSGVVSFVRGFLTPFCHGQETIAEH